MIVTGINVTGFDRVDTAAAEIALLVRDSAVYREIRRNEQYYYDEAMRLRDEIIAGLAPHYHSVTGEEEIPCWCKNPGGYAAPVTGRNSPWGES